MSRVYAGATLILGGIAAFIVAHRHVPVPARRPEIGVITPASGLSPTAYDLLRLGGWALVILGTLTAVVGLIHYAVRYARAEGSDSAGTRSLRRSPPRDALRTGKPLALGEVETSAPWDEGSHGEAVQPSPR
jgi:hypothetical protein